MRSHWKMKRETYVVYKDEKKRPKESTRNRIEKYEPSIGTKNDIKIMVTGKKSICTLHAKHSRNGSLNQ